MDPAISSLIASVEQGDRAAADALFAALYSELHQLAKARLARSAGNLTLGTTTLLHEAYLDLARRDPARFPDRSKFMAYASRAMRGLIIDYVRNRKAQKRGGEFEITSLESDVADTTTDLDLAQVGQALDQLAEVDPELVQIVDLKFFCGFSFEEIAAICQRSERTIYRQWEKARIFLRDALGRNV